MSAPALVGNALVLHSLCYSIAPLPCFPPGDFVRVHTPSCRVYTGGLWLVARPNHYAL
jgi:hypothetical protein